jgi:hypothetical protein
LHLAPCTLHLAPCTLHLAPCTLQALVAFVAVQSSHMWVFVHCVERKRQKQVHGVDYGELHFFSFASDFSSNAPVLSEWPQLFTLANEKAGASFLEGKEPFVLDVGVPEPLGQFLPENQMFVRRCYLDIFPSVWDMFKKEQRVAVTLTGTPGIGKH